MLLLFVNVDVDDASILLIVDPAVPAVNAADADCDIGDKDQKGDVVRLLN